MPGRRRWSASWPSFSWRHLRAGNPRHDRGSDFAADLAHDDLATAEAGKCGRGRLDQVLVPTLDRRHRLPVGRISARPAMRGSRDTAATTSTAGTRGFKMQLGILNGACLLPTGSRRRLNGQICLFRPTWLSGAEVAFDWAKWPTWPRMYSGARVRHNCRRGCMNESSWDTAVQDAELHFPIV